MFRPSQHNFPSTRHLIRLSCCINNASNVNHWFTLQEKCLSKRTFLAAKSLWTKLFRDKYSIPAAISLANFKKTNSISIKSSNLRPLVTNRKKMQINLHMSKLTLAYIAFNSCRYSFKSPFSRSSKQSRTYNYYICGRYF